MKLFKATVFVSLIIGFFAFSTAVYAATSPSLGDATSFGILADTYTNTAPGTTINGDLGYTVGPAVSPTVNGDTHIANSTYNQAGIDQNSALSDLNSQPCTFSYAPGAIDLATDTTTPDGVGQFTPGVYCIEGAASIGGGGNITLTGAGTYIFRMDGALDTSAGSTVTLAGDASVCDVWWTPTAATTLGANSTFVGTDISAAGITIGSNAIWEGRALAFGGTVSTDVNTITVPAACATAPDNGTPVTAPDNGTPVTAPDNGTPGDDTPGLPDTGFGPHQDGNFPWWIIPTVITSVAGIYLIQKKRKLTSNR